MRKHISAAAIAIAIALSGQARAQTPAPDCDDLVWSAQVLAANPDIALSCQGVYARNNELYAKVIIKITRVRGNRLTFRPRHTDGTQGAPRSILVDAGWRADIQGRKYRAGELLPGQELNVYIPEDRFALAMDDGAFDGDEELINIENAVVVTMPKTASSLFSVLGTAAVMLSLGLVLTTQRRLRRPKP